MRFLLDTHTFLWLEDNNPALSSRVRDILSDTRNTIFLSHVSVWEVQIKLSIGKIKGKLPLKERVEAVQSRSGLVLLPVITEHIYLLNDLPLYHRDPFDRLLIAQAMVEGIPLLSKDAIFPQYAVQTIW